MAPPPSPTLSPKLAERYAVAAKEAGVPREQLLNLIKAGAVLTPKQLRASALARECDLPGGPTEIGYGGARGGGKSHWVIVQVAIDDCQRCPGLKVLFLRKVGKAGAEGFGDLRIRTLQGLPHRYREDRGTLKFANGSRIILGHFLHEKDIDAYLGLEYDVIVVEEATTLSANKIKRIRTCLRTSKPDWRPRMYLTTNPGGIGHSWFRKQFILPWRRRIQTDTRFVPATVDDNPHVNAEYTEQLDKLTGWEYLAWRLGDWDILAGQFFSTFSEEVHVIDPLEGLAPVRSWCGFDYGFTHYTYSCLLQKDGDANVYVTDEHAARQTLPTHHAPAIESMLRRHGLDFRQTAFYAGTDCWMRGRDSQGLTIADQYSKLGITLTQANTDRINGAAEILARLGDPFGKGPEGQPRVIPPRLYIYRNCVRLIESIQALVHDEHRPEDVDKLDWKEGGDDVSDDPYDGFRYGLMDDFESSATPLNIDPSQRFASWARHAAA